MSTISYLDFENKLRISPARSLLYLLNKINNILRFFVNTLCCKENVRTHSIRNSCSLNLQRTARIWNYVSHQEQLLIEREQCNPAEREDSAVSELFEKYEEY